MSLAAFFFAAPAVGGKVTGKVTIQGAKKDSSHAVVYLEGVPDDGKAPPPPKMWQRDKQFDPQVVVVVKGQSIEFPNGDSFFHNVFSVSKAARFDLGLYKSGESKGVTFKRAGVVDVYCNIHPQMVAKILVVENRYFAKTSKTGEFAIEGVPAGTYSIVGWLSHGKPWKGTVTVVDGKAAKVDIPLVEDKGSEDHVRKDGTPYGRYK
ncbi:MAG TPA: carboxypeptidase regulatory-like domain-containing protein [Nannocystaceae bacterium]|nr:carboxypeptidase regulatory-like domain-containing protein [Nannocystaceae bacterium]